MSAPATSDADAASSALTARLTRNAIFALLDVLLTKACTMLILVAFVRLIPESRNDEAVAAITIAYGWVVLLAFLEVTPIRVVLRDWPRFTGSARKRNRLLTGMAGWWLAQSLLILAGAGAVCLLTPQTLPHLHLAVVGLTLNFLAESLQFWVKTVLYASFRQPLETGLSLIASLTRLGLVIGGLLYAPGVVTYALCLVAAAGFTTALYTGTLFRVVGFRPVVDRLTLPRLRRSVGGYGIWDHLNISVIDALFMIDPLILQQLLIAGRADAAQVSAYGIALRFVSMLIIIPQQLTRTLQVALANAADRVYAERSFNSIFKLSKLVAIAELTVVALLARPLLELLFGGVSADTVRYTRLLACAMCIMCVAWPCLAVVNHSGNLRGAFFGLFLPILPLGLLTYAAAGWWAGPLGVAEANIAVYAILAVTLFGFARRTGGLRLRPALLAPHERDSLRALLRR